MKFNYGGTNNVKMNGGTYAALVVNAPNSCREDRGQSRHLRVDRRQKPSPTPAAPSCTSIGA
jgi:hypothetical protein